MLAKIPHIYCGLEENVMINATPALVKSAAAINLLAIPLVPTLDPALASSESVYMAKWSILSTKTIGCALGQVRELSNKDTQHQS